MFVVRIECYVVEYVVGLGVSMVVIDVVMGVVGIGGYGSDGGCCCVGICLV